MDMSVFHLRQWGYRAFQRKLAGEFHDWHSGIANI